MPSMQETFDTVVAHLRRQDAKAQIPGSRPGEMTFVYRAPDGKRVPVGVLIPDDHYDPALEYTVVGGTDEAATQKLERGDAADRRSLVTTSISSGLCKACMTTQPWPRGNSSSSRSPQTSGSATAR